MAQLPTNVDTGGSSWSGHQTTFGGCRRRQFLAI